MNCNGINVNTQRASSSEVSFVLGVYSGYAHNNTKIDGSQYTFDQVANICLEHISDHADEFGGFVSFIIEPCKTLYPYKGGCPAVGEDCYKFTANYNPDYGMEKNKFQNACILYADSLRKLFNQSTITVTIKDGTSVQLCYIKD